MRIGHCAQQYPERRNIIGRVGEAHYKLCRDIYGLQRAIRHRLGLRGSEEYEFLFDDLGLNYVDVYHFFNHINMGKWPWKRPWAVTFETFLPRIPKAFDAWRLDGRVTGDRLLRGCLDALASDGCCRLIALSKNALEIQDRFLQIYPEYQSSIIGKTIVLHPPQETFDSAGESRRNADPIHFAIVGHAFFRKGGREIIRALAALRSRGRKEFRLTVVSQIKPDNYATKTGADDVQSARRKIAENSQWITHYESLSSSEVHRLMQTVDVGLLPSYAETYGYSMLEFQAHGVPVITTNIRAFPEINTDDCGWLVKVEKNAVGEAFYQGDQERACLSRAIEEQLLQLFEGITSEPSLIEQKGRAAQERIRVFHQPKHHAEVLFDVYTGHG